IESRFEDDAAKSGFWGSRLAKTITLLTIVNIIFLGGISTQMLHFMDEPVFCGTACHSVMNPEWVTYQQSPHSRVACIQCHVGEGAGALLDSKLNGIWQMVSVTFDLLERPIPTPVHQLRPARQTCEKCHWPEKFYGTRLKTIARYQHDSASTELYTTLNLKVDVGSADSRAGIHWHVGQENEVRYFSLDDEREKIIWAEVRRPDGSYHRYTSKNKIVSEIQTSAIRTLDCVDCHNRATHIYENPEWAIDDRIQRGILDKSLPFFKREALHAITGSYSDKQAAMEGISNHLHGYYQRNYPKIGRNKSILIDSAINVLQAIYARNIHPEMNIEWGVYASHIGHVGDGGCFRCHNSKLVDEDGNSISYDCALCHSMLANGHKNPFKYLKPADTADIDFPVHQYLQGEFLQSFGDRENDDAREL
ncbi:MAG: NapC/NirT family cytochrome c, partial [candidate division Zixibacteria bacterium]